MDELAEIFDGPHATPKKVPAGPWFLSISSLQRGRLVLDESAHISDEDFVKWTRRVEPRADDVLFSYETRLGEAALMPTGLRACLGRRMGLLRPKLLEVNPRFLLYAYLGPEFQATVRQRAVQGATVDRIPLNQMSSWPVRVPDRRCQDSIASVLGALDDKIDLTRSINVSLGRILQAVIARLWAEAPGRFEEKALGEVAEIVDCLHSAKPGRVAQGHCVLLQLHNLNADGTLSVEDKYLISPSDYSLWTSRIELSPGDCVITNVGRVGAVAQIPEGVRAAAGRNMTGIRARRGLVSPTYLLEALLSPRVRDEIRLNTDTGTILDSLNVRNIGKLRFPVPRPDLSPSLEARLRPLRTLMEANLRERATLEQLRDALLPELMSGRMTVN